MRGLITEVIAILAVILGFIGAKIWGQDSSAWLLTQFTWPQPVCDAVAYALLFLGIAVALAIVGKLLSKLLKAISLAWLNRLLGALFGLLKWGLIVLAIVFCVNKLDQQFHFLQPELKQQSIIYPEAVKLADKALDYVTATTASANPSR